MFVLAGVPSIARSMFETIAPDLAGGDPIYSRNVDIYLREGDIAGPLQNIASKYGDIEIGSYPFKRDGRFGANLVVRGTDEAQLALVLEEIIATMTEDDKKY